MTTEIRVDTNYTGIIQEVQNGSFAKTRISASLKLSDSTITYDAIEKSSPIAFGTIATGGVTSINSTPNLLIADNSTNTFTHTFPSIKVNNVIGAIPATT